MVVYIDLHVHFYEPLSDSNRAWLAPKNPGTLISFVNKNRSPDTSFVRPKDRMLRNRSFVPFIVLSLMIVVGAVGIEVPLVEPMVVRG